MATVRRVVVALTLAVAGIVAMGTDNAGADAGPCYEFERDGTVIKAFPVASDCHQPCRATPPPGGLTGPCPRAPA
jgi:hypothetical protein